jgi:adenosylcobyric acid synthase
VVAGYEIHMGTTLLHEEAIPLGTIVARGDQRVQIADGAQVASGRIWGSYLHGIFEDDHFRRAWLAQIGWRGDDAAPALARQEEYNRLADAVEAAVDWAHFEQVTGISLSKEFAR